MKTYPYTVALPFVAGSCVAGSFFIPSRSPLPVPSPVYICHAGYFVLGTNRRVPPPPGKKRRPPRLLAMSNLPTVPSLPSVKAVGLAQECESWPTEQKLYDM